MNKVMLNFFFCCFFFLFISASLSAQPSEKSFLEAWELIQMNDSQTLIFEKLAENHYRFKTKKLPFDGELKILNIIIDENENEYTGSFIWGVAEVELVDLPEDFLEKHPYGYSMWQQNNTLYFDKKTQKWVTSKEYFSKMPKKYKDQPGKSIDIFSSSLYNIVSIVVLIILILFWAKMKKKTDDSVKKSFALNEETNRLLKEILEELRKK